MPKAALVLIPILAAALLIWFFYKAEPSGWTAPVPEAEEVEESNRQLPPQPRIALPEDDKKDSERTEPGIETSPSEAEPVDPVAAGQGRLLLEVVDRLSGEPLAAFNLVIRAPGRERVDRPVDAANQQVDLPLDVSFNLSIEAAGYEPSVIEDLLLEGEEPERRIRVKLERILQGSGVSLEVRDHLFMPVTRLRLSLSSRDLQSQDPADLVLLWQREAENADGIFPLPDLAPAHYLFAIQALDAAGRLAPFMLVEHELSYYGAEQVPIPIQLRQGALLSLEVRNLVGQLLGSEVVMRLENATGEHIETRWLAEEEDSTLEAIDMLPAAKTCRLGQVLAPGRYLLRLQTGKGQLDHPFEVRAGQKLDLKLSF